MCSNIILLVICQIINGFADFTVSASFLILIAFLLEVVQSTLVEHSGPWKEIEAFRLSA